LGQKVHPISFRLESLSPGIPWYAEKDYSELLIEDIRIREYLKKNFTMQGSPRSRLNGLPASPRRRRSPSSRRPGIIIGKKGAEVENLKRELQKRTQKEIFINIQEVKRAETDAQLVAENVALQLERRVGFRRAMKKAVTSALKLGAKELRLLRRKIGRGRNGPQRMVSEGRVPLHTLRADIDFGQAKRRRPMGSLE